MGTELAQVYRTDTCIHVRTTMDRVVDGLSIEQRWDRDVEEGNSGTGMTLGCPLVSISITSKRGYYLIIKYLYSSNCKQKIHSAKNRKPVYRFVNGCISGSSRCVVTSGTATNPIKATHDDHSDLCRNPGTTPLLCSFRLVSGKRRALWRVRLRPPCHLPYTHLGGRPYVLCRNHLI